MCGTSLQVDIASVPYIERTWRWANGRRIIQRKTTLGWQRSWEQLKNFMESNTSEANLHQKTQGTETTEMAGLVHSMMENKQRKKKSATTSKVQEIHMSIGSWCAHALWKPSYVPCASGIQWWERAAISSVFSSSVQQQRWKMCASQSVLVWCCVVQWRAVHWKCSRSAVWNWCWSSVWLQCPRGREYFMSC